MASAWVFVATLGCGVRRPDSTESPGAIARHAAVTSERNVLAVDAQLRAGASNAFEIVQKLRPLFLRGHGIGDAPAVFVDGSRFGGIETLRQIPAADVAGIRYLGSAEATQRFGTGYTAGIVQIVTVGRR